jgi:thiamine biosynthesis lipoprotein
MACDFDVVMNPDPTSDQLDAASAALDLVHELEQQLSVYRSDSELSELNRRAFQQPVAVEAKLFELLERGRQLSTLTGGAFDPASGALVNLWRRCRQEFRIPTPGEIETTLPACGIANAQFDQTSQMISYLREGIEFNLGAIGKGYAVDRAAETLRSRGVLNWLVHGGRSSIRARGTHAGHDGWPVGLRNPLMPDKPYATLLLKDAAIGTSGTAVQWFRHEGKRYGHILDPRSGWPVETLLSVSVIAPDAAMADALSTAFFVLGVEKSLKCCDNLPASVGAIFFPLPSQGQTLEPILHNVSGERWFANRVFSGK